MRKAISHHFFRRLLFPCLVALAVSSFAWGTVKADIAPPPPPTGSNPLTGADTVTQVQMAAETVIFDIAPNSKYKNGQARVTATFTMHNPSSQSETMPVRFPLSSGDESGGIIPCEYSSYIWTFDNE